MILNTVIENSKHVSVVSFTKSKIYKEHRLIVPPACVALSLNFMQ